MSTRADVFDFLLPLDPRHSIISLGEAMIDAASNNETAKAVAEAVDAVFTWLANEEKPLINEKQIEIYHRIRRANNSLGIDDIPDILEPIIVVLYLRAKTAFQAMGSKPFIRNLSENLQKVNPALDAMAPEFFGELLVETELRAGRDPAFAKTLERTAKEITTQIQQFEALEQRGEILLMKGKCYCIVRVYREINGREYRDICIDRWWVCVLIFLAIIIVIVLG